MRSRVSARQPSEEIPVVDEEVIPRELMRIEEEGADDEGEQRYPEVQKPDTPDGESGEKQHHQEPSTEIDGRTGETRVQDTERNPGRRKTTSRADISSTSERQILRQGIGIDLTDEDLEEG